MRVNINILEELLLKLQCKFAEAIYSEFIKTQYSMVGCKSEIDIEELREFILILKGKIKLLKYNFGLDSLEEPTKITKTSIEYFFEKEKYLTNCDRRFLEKIL